MSSRGSSPSFVELPVLPPSRRISAARRRLTTPTTLAKDDGGAENDRPLSQSGETDEASHTNRDSTASLQNSHSHSQAHSGHIGDLSLDAASDRGSSGTPHSPALRSPASIVSTSAGPMPPQARRKLSTAASSSAAAAAAACDTSLSSSSLTARRMWTHFAERDVLTAHRTASPNDMESSCPLGVEPLPVSRADTTHGSPWPSSSPTAKMAPSGVTKTAHEANLKSPCTRSPSLPPSSSEVLGPMLQPRSTARRPSASLQPGASCDFPQVQVDATRAAAADERALSTSSSPSTPPSTSFKQEDGAAPRAAGEEKGLTNFLPALHTTSASWCEERDNTAHFHGAPATLSFPTRLRLHQSGPPPPRRLSQQVSLSFECAEEEKTMTSTTNSESLPPHGLSPSSAVPSDAQSSVPFFSDLLWRARASRVDLRSPPSPTHSSQRHELEAQPPRSCSAMLAERRVSLPTPALQPLDQPETLYDFDRASPRAWHLLNEPPPRTRSAVYSATPSRIRGAHLVPPINDPNHLARSTGGHTRSSTSHGARCAVAAPRSASQRSTRATTLTADAPLRPRLNPLLHSPPSAPRYPGGQPPLTPLRCESPAGSVGRFDGATPQIGRSRTPSQERFSPLHQPMASLPFPGPRRGPTALPSIPATPRMVSSCPPEPFGTEGEEGEREHEAAGVDGRSAVERRRCSSPRRAAAAVPFSLASTRRTGEGGNVWSSSPSTQDVSAVEEEAVTAVEYASPTPPPPPWTPAEALYWMSSRLTRQEAREMLAYDQVYYCGPAVPPRTACGVTETSSAVSREKEAVHYGGEDAVHAAGPPRPHLANQNPAAASPSSYFPITLGMHIRFRYEVTEVLGFGTFSVVVRAIDHAAAPLSPERHCALKLIRKEALYQQAAQDEWATYARVKACCGAPVDGEEEGDRDNPSNVDVVDASAASPHHRRRSSCPGPSLSLTQRLSTADQRTICGAAIVTPRTRFEFRGYHVMVLPLLGFSLRDVLELRRESDEAAVREEAEVSTISGARPVLSFSEAATGFPRAVGASILAQVVHALAFLHRTAHLLHGDLKPENVVFVDRMVSQGHTEASPTMPFSDQQRVSFLRNSDGALAPFFAAAHAGATSSTSLVPFFRSSSVGHHYRLFSLPQNANTTDAAAASAATPPASEEEAGVPLRTPTLRTTPAASAASPPAALDSAVQWMRSCAAGDASKSGGSVEGEHSGGTVHANLSVNHVPHTPSRCTPGLTSSRTGTLAPPHHGPLTDVLTLEDSGEESAVASASRIATATATPVSAVPPAFAVEGSRGGSDTAATHHHSTSRLSRRNTVASTSSDLALFASAAQTSTRIAVIDLGHAKPLAPWQTGTAFPLQSPSYRAPEMALRLPYTTAIDMWSLGCVLYELSTGHVLLPGAGDDATMLSAAVGVLGMPDTTFLAMVKMCWKEYKLRKASGSTATGGDVDALPLNALSAYVTEGDGGAEAVSTSTTAAAGPVSGLSDEEAAMERCWKSFIQVLNASAGQQRARAERRRRQSTPIYISGNASGNTEPGKAKEGDAAPAVVRVTPWETLAQSALLVELFPDGEVSVAEQTFSLATSVSAPQRPEYFRADFLLGCLYWDASERLSAVEAQYHPYVADLFTTEAEAEASGQQQQQQQPLPHCSGVFYLQHHPLTTRLFTRSQSANGGRRSSEDRSREQPSRDSLPPSRGTSLSTLPLRPLAPSAIFPFDLPSSKRAAPSAKAWEEHQQQRHHQHAATTDGAGENGGWCTPRGQRLSVFCGHFLSPSVEEAGPHAATAAAAAALLHIGLHRRDERTPIHDVDLVSPDRHGTEYEAGMDDEAEEGECSARQDGHEVMVLRLD